MKKIFTINIACIFLASLYGCGTIKNLNSEDGYPYGGIKNAVTFEGPCNVATVCVLYYPLIIIASPFIIADIALSAIGDTVTYPIAKSIETDRINELKKIPGVYSYENEACYYSYSFQKEQKGSVHKKKLMRVETEFRSKYESEDKWHICEPRSGQSLYRGPMVCSKNVSGWNYYENKVLIYDGNHQYLSVVKEEEKIIGLKLSSENPKCQGELFLRKN